MILAAIPSHCSLCSRSCSSTRLKSAVTAGVSEAIIVRLATVEYCRPVNCATLLPPTLRTPIKNSGSQAFYTILVEQVRKYVSAYSAVAWAGLLGSLTTAAYSILTGQFALPYDLSALAWGSYFYVIFIGSLVGMLFWNKGIRVIGPSQAAVFMNLMPLVGIICGIAFLDESFYTSEAVGGALIIAGVYLTTQYRLLAYKLARYLVKRRGGKLVRLHGSADRPFDDDL